MKWLVILVLLSNILPVAAGSPWHSELSSLNKSLATNVESPRTNQVEIDQSLIANRAALTHQNHAQALAQVQSLIRIEPTITDQAVKLAEKILVMLIEESKKEAGRKEALFEDFAEAMLTAKKTADIDPWLAMLNKEVQSHQQSRTQGAYGYGNASQTLVPPDGHQKFLDPES